MMHRLRRTALAVAVLAAPAGAVVVPESGYVYGTQLLANLTQSCVAAGPGGTFVGIGPSFSPNAQAVVLARPSGDLRLVAFGFNAIGDCAYDRATDTLYVTDNGGTGDFPGALTGDTVFAVPSASTAAGLSTTAIELLPPDSVPFAANLALSGGDVLVSNAAGPGLGSVLRIAAGPVVTPFASPFDYTAGLAADPDSGDVFVAETLAGFDSQIRRFTAAGAPVPPLPFAGPSFGFGSYDLAFDADGRLLVTGAFGGDVLAFDPTDASSTPFASGLTFTSGVTVDPFTGRVTLLSTTFSNADEDRSLHHFTPVAALAAGGGSTKSDCLHAAYGLALTGKEATCVDGAACDADGTVNDACVFPLGFCFNVNAPGLETCDTGAPITAATITAKPASAAVTAAATAVAAALPLSAAHCAFSDGYAVPVKITKSGKKDGKASVKVQAVSDDGRKDTDTYKLVCQPAP